MHAPVVAAHAVNAYSVQSGPTVAAAPVSHQPAYAQNTTPNHVFSTRPPPGRWADGICDWPKNMFPSCYCACCCCYGMWLAAQSKLIFYLDAVEGHIKLSLLLRFKFFSGAEGWVLHVPVPCVDVRGDLDRGFHHHACHWSGRVGCSFANVLRIFLRHRLAHPRRQQGEHPGVRRLLRRVLLWVLVLVLFRRPK
jgi:hypothetical protein